ncbi:ribosome biogenesis GTPase Lsg1 [Ascosphaera apis ARSEF 7405]|uniref:Ribosome biogenesis GTPase Lsg1 n=1 Tax=Ascosphaera apis ARSEF 7405 TaxID=392613 RepID=A0A167WE66_9EURO|nr:ribosome biogenesis GTPase Lsg1 [Ascosphaera apis ARSEF 7405]
MPLAKSKNSVGLGNALMNDRFGKGKGSDRKKVTHNSRAIKRTGVNGETYVTNPSEEAAWVKMRSITEQGALDEFLGTAELAGTDFTAEKLNNVKIIHTDQKNPWLLSAAEERSATQKHKKNRGRLTIPRRPKWDSTTTKQQLDLMERQSFLDWRRGLAELQENQDLLMTPFERNLEVWRQLWRVIERSDLVVQIVDARNPTLFRCEDLDRYVKEVDPKKKNLLLVNKADMMTEYQRQVWADYFEEMGIAYSFFSAQLAKERNEAMLAGEEHIEAESELLNDTKTQQQLADDAAAAQHKKDRTRIITVDDLEELFIAASPDADEDAQQEEGAKKKVTTIGLVGYPNVGKSSTINALLGAKKVSVSATPGKTKHFQTLYLSPTLMLCDCPGLVFPNFATTKAELVVNGILPIDQLREYYGPAGIVAKRIPKSFLEAVYGMRIVTRPLEEGGTGVPTASEMLSAYARARGYATTGLGQPDESRAVRYILKDYVNGKLLYCHPPPNLDVDPAVFNRDLYDLDHLPERRRKAILSNPDYAPLTSTTPSATAEDAESDMVSVDTEEPAVPQGPRSAHLDNRFFQGNGRGNAAHLTMPFNHQYTEQGAAAHQKQLSGRKQRMMVALETGVDPADVQTNGKKHFKGGKKMRAKERRKLAGEYED